MEVIDSLDLWLIFIGHTPLVPFPMVYRLQSDCHLSHSKRRIYEYIKNGNETKINGRNLYPIYTKE